MKVGLSRVVTLVGALFLSSAALAQSMTPVSELESKAAAGDLEAKMKLAERYYKGEGVEKNLAKAADWYTQLAEEEYAHAQLALGLMYIKGEGVDKNDAKAVEWLKRAASQRLASAQYLLGVAYEEGHGVDADLTTAYMWYEIAAALTNNLAETAQKRIAAQLSAEQIADAESKASQWWLKHHH